ncbi:hypothetical protein Leryth_011699 [Lithospermum erythrorhizon]|nr:hypothetical protein Leryth_011699 [Lithospermum erythrorhizon]
MAISSIQETLLPFHSRKLLPSPSFNLSSSSTSAMAPSSSSHYLLEPSTRVKTFHANIVMVILVLVCALIGSLGLKILIKCVMRCSSLVSFNDNSRNPNNSTTLSGKLANTGIKKKALKTFPVVKYSRDIKIPGLESECVICLANFSLGEKIKLLPKCNHGFHVKCIDRWLNCHSSCPTCRHCLIETCHKIVGGEQWC